MGKIQPFHVRTWCTLYRSACKTKHGISEGKLAQCGLKKNLNASGPSEYPPARGNNVKTFKSDLGLQRQDLFMAFSRVPQ